MPEPEDVSVVLTVLNERDNLEPLHARLTGALKLLARAYEIIYVDDGSSDGSWELLRTLAAGDSRVRLVRLRKNFGQTPALSAGLAHSRYPILVTLDADLQNDPALGFALPPGLSAMQPWFPDLQGVPCATTPRLPRGRRRREDSRGRRPRVIAESARAE